MANVITIDENTVEVDGIKYERAEKPTVEKFVDLFVGAGVPRSCITTGKYACYDTINIQSLVGSTPSAIRNLRAVLKVASLYHFNGGSMTVDGQSLWYSRADDTESIKFHIDA